MPAQTFDTVEEVWDESALEAGLSVAERTTSADFVELFREFVNPNGRGFAYRSGSEALTSFLRGVVSGPKKRVLICSFNCPLVADAVSGAGGQVDTYDLGSRCGEFHWDHIAEVCREDTAAIVVPHLFGVPVDFDGFYERSRDLGLTVIEDCAHTLGGWVGDRMAGSIGDAAIFSFNYDKPVSLGGTGLLMLNNRTIPAPVLPEASEITVRQEYESLLGFLRYMRARRRGIGSSSGIRGYRERVRRAVALRGRRSPPRAAGIGRLRAALGIAQLAEYPETLKVRNRHAARIESRSDGRSWYVGANVKPAWLKQKVIVDPEEASAISETLCGIGYRVGRFNWPRTIEEHLNGDRHAGERPVALSASRSALDVPIHQNVQEGDLDIMANALFRRM